MPSAPVSTPRNSVPSNVIFPTRLPLSVNMNRLRSTVRNPATRIARRETTPAANPPAKPAATIQASRMIQSEMTFPRETAPASACGTLGAVELGTPKLGRPGNHIRPDQVLEVRVDGHPGFRSGDLAHGLDQLGLYPGSVHRVAGQERVPGNAQFRSLVIEIVAHHRASSICRTGTASNFRRRATARYCI